MARTNLAVITAALRLSGIIHQIQTPSNEDAQDGLSRLNDMMLGWKRVNGIDLGYVLQTSLAANIPVDDEYFEPIQLNLARKIAEHWGVQLAPETMDGASREFQSLVRQFSMPEPADMSHTPLRRSGWYNIESG